MGTILRCLWLLAGILVLAGCKDAVQPAPAPAGPATPAGFGLVTGTLKLPASASTGAAKNAKVFVMGQEEFAVTADASGAYSLKVNVKKSATPNRSLSRDAGSLSYQLVTLTENADLGHTAEVVVQEQVNTPQPDLNLAKTATLTGLVTLDNGSLDAPVTDFTGIQVYIPGTSFQARTDAQGRFTLTKIPPGSYPFLRAEKTGYKFGLVKDVILPAEATTEMPPLVLGLSTGSTVSVSIADGALFSTSRTVKLSFNYSSDAALMKYSEDPDFINVPWRALTQTTSYSFTSDGQKRLYIMVADDNGLEVGPFSDDIVIAEDPKVRLTAPLGIVNASKPSLSWESSILPNVTYDLEVSENSDFSAPLLTKYGLSAANFAAPAALPPNKALNWRVAIVNERGQRLNWATGTFTIGLDGPPLLAPVNGAVVPESKPNFTWEASKIPGVTYRFQLATTADFASPLSDITALVQPGFTPAASVPYNTPVFWRVSLVDANSVQGAWSDSRSYTYALPKLELTAPANGLRQTSSKPDFSWTASNLSAVRYRLQTSVDPAFATLLVDDQNLLVPFRKPSVGLVDKQVTYWRVALVDADGKLGPWSDPRQIIFDLGTPVLSTPADNAALTNPRPTFSWSAVTDAAQYRLQVATSSGFSPLSFEQLVTGSTSFTPTADLPDGGTYYWRVAAVEAQGGQGPWTTYRSYSLPGHQLVVNLDLNTYPGLPDPSTNSIDLVLPLGSFTTLSVNYSGMNYTKFEWTFQGSVISGETSSSYRVENIPNSSPVVPLPAGNYQFEVTAWAGSVPNSIPYTKTISVKVR